MRGPLNADHLALAHSKTVEYTQGPRNGRADSAPADLGPYLVVGCEVRYMRKSLARFLERLIELFKVFLRLGRSSASFPQLTSVSLTMGVWVGRHVR